jgi:hypothetical protein
VHRKRPIGAFIPRAGKPHVCDELVVVAGSTEPGRPAPGPARVFARGAVRHADHKTVWLRRWHEVHRNRELDEGRAAFGGTWVD